jgi:hypothetical protein
MRNWIKFIWIAVFLGVPIVPAFTPRTVLSGATTCPEIVTGALKTADRLCEKAGRNQACYGHITLEASPQPEVAEFVFDEEGDVVNVVDVQTLRLSAMDETTGSWGVALMRVQAGLKDVSSVEPVILLLFGDVEIENAMTMPSSTVDVAVVAGDTVNVRSTPSAGAEIVGRLRTGQIVTATGRLVDGTWLRIALPNSGGVGWVYAPLLEAKDGIASLDVVEGSSSPAYGPMQAFYFRSGGSDTTCPQANNGLLIQTPEGVAQVSLLINEVDIQLGSTVFFQAQPGEAMTISVVEGSARVEAAGGAEKAYAGSQITVPLTDDLKPAGPPEPPKAYDMSEMEFLPVDYLARPISVHAPLTEDELVAAQEKFEEEEAAPDTPATNPDESTDGNIPPGQIKDDDELPPGLIDNPGLDGSIPPGQGGTPPGQDDKDKEDKDKDK